MPDHILLLIKKVDNIDTVINSDIVQTFKNENNADIDIDNIENRYTSIHKEINDYDVILWTDDVRSLTAKDEIQKVINDDDDIVVSKDKHLWIVKGNDNVRKLMYHWSQSTKDIYKTQRWKNEAVELDTLNVKNNVQINDNNTNVTQTVNNIIKNINNVNEHWLIIVLIVLLIIVATKL